ncbi:hypothetical protein PTTG_27327 [Puccinia triticina 1-1 BBBD Race 1]|uniref:Uncharacterized protein n=1 Tax=Puccinia triticina (isolate 1-1 / race 1 (BBBD)) TaxID=630390 RepID=A0A180GLK5_PUCT1|nr:hypothetical protein PTTG_27327 [Puccinia triticina 1-1 BBBD Race 1]
MLCRPGCKPAQRPPDSTSAQSDVASAISDTKVDSISPCAAFGSTFTTLHRYDMMQPHPWSIQNGFWSMQPCSWSIQPCCLSMQSRFSAMSMQSWSEDQSMQDRITPVCVLIKQGRLQSARAWQSRSSSTTRLCTT